MERTIIAPLNTQDLPLELSMDLEGCGIDLEELLLFLFVNYNIDEYDQDLRFSIYEKFVNQAKGDGSDKDSPWMTWDAYRNFFHQLDVYLMRLREQFNVFLRIEGFIAPPWPELHLVRLLGSDVYFTIRHSEAGQSHETPGLRYIHYS